MLTDKEKNRIKEKVRKRVLRAVVSILKWASKRAYPNVPVLTEEALLEMALKLEAIGLTSIDKKKRMFFLQKSLSVLNWAEARTKAADASVGYLLELSLKVLMVEKQEAEKE